MSKKSVDRLLDVLEEGGMVVVNEEAWCAMRDKEEMGEIHRPRPMDLDEFTRMYIRDSPMLRLTTQLFWKLSVPVLGGIIGDLVDIKDRLNHEMELILYEACRALKDKQEGRDEKIGGERC